MVNITETIEKSRPVQIGWQPGCKNCPTPGMIDNPDAPEYFSYLGTLRYNVAMAKKMVAAMPASRIGTLSREQIEKFGFSLEDKTTDEAGVTHFSIGFYYHNEAHLSHIPADKLDAPVIIATLTMSNMDKVANLAHLKRLRRGLATLRGIELDAVIATMNKAIKKEESKPDLFTSHILIDGSHRCVRKYRLGAESVDCVLLTVEESKSLLGGTYGLPKSFYPVAKAKATARRNKK